MKITNKEELINCVNSGNKVKYIFFWGHQQGDSGITKSCFSQWYQSPFKVNGILYPTAEHLMMAEKARLFGDRQALKQILIAKHPGEAKKIGRTVVGFEQEIWVGARFEIVVAANLAKFSQNPELKEFLLKTGDRVLVEASPMDRIWGIGLAANDSACENPNLWKGLNLLGFALMKVRSLLYLGLIGIND